MDEMVSVDQLTTEILIYKQQTTQNIIEIGKRLMKVKEQLPHGEWGKWLEERVEFTQWTANKFMRVANELNCGTFNNLAQSKVFALLDLPQDQREDFVESNPVEDMTTRELKKAIKEKKEAERRAQEAEKALQEERSKPPEVVEKVVQKVVHRPPSDYAENIDENRKLRIRLMNEETKMKELADENRRLQIKAKENEAADQLADEYIELKKKLRTIAQSNSDSTNLMMALSDVIEFTTDVEHMLETKLAPIKYKRAFQLIANDPDVLDNVQSMVAGVTKWAAEITELIEGAKATIYPYGKYEEEEDYERIE